MLAGRAAIATRCLDLLLVSSLIAIALWRLLPAVDTTSFHRDEARWIGNSAILREWRNPFSSRWQDEGYVNRFGSLDEATRRRNQAPFAMYVIGLGLLIQGQGLPTVGYWIMSQDAEWNSERGNMPSPSELRAGRLTNVAVAVLTVIAIYALGALLTNRVGGVTSALIYAAHPLIRTDSTRAWSDPLLVLLIALAALAAWRLGERPTWLRAAVLAVALGFGAATKLSPLPVAAGLGLIGLAFWLCSWVPQGADWRRLRGLGVRLAAIPVIAFATFVASYPYLWPSPIANAYRMYEFRADSFELQAMNEQANVPNRTDAFRRVGEELGERFSLGGYVVEAIERWLSVSLPSSIAQLDLVLALAGLVILIGMAGRDGFASPRSLVLAVLGGHVLLILLTIRVEYARYFMPIVLLMAVTVGVVAGAAWKVVALARRWTSAPFASLAATQSQASAIDSGS